MTAVRHALAKLYPTLASTDDYAAATAHRQNENGKDSGVGAHTGLRSFIQGWINVIHEDNTPFDAHQHGVTILRYVVG
jgi:hypothetical protein